MLPVTTDDLLLLIGQKEVEIQLLRRRVEAARVEVARLIQERDANQAAQTPQGRSPDGPASPA